MGLYKGILLGAGAAMVSVAAAQAADLPSRKAAPVEYVRICDAYGAGFFFIPGTDSCLRITGRLRAEYGFSPAQSTLKVANSTASIDKNAAGLQEAGWEARARMGFDVRTRTSMGTLQAVGVLRLSRSSGLFSESGRPKDAAGDDTWLSPTGAGATLEAAYIRFAGFTFGAARDNFSFMPSVAYASNHWAAFGNGAKQIAYTHSFGGGFSATVALQDYNDTTATGKDSVKDTVPSTAVQYHYRYDAGSPQVNANLALTQGWGQVQVMGAFANPTVTNGNASYDTSVWALGAGVKINLPMLARGSAFYATAAYADGMTEYTTNWTSFKSSAQKREVGGFVVNHPSFTMNAAGDGLENVKSWSVAALLEHYWSPTWRSVVFGSYGQIDASAGQAAGKWDGKQFFGDATVWKIGKQIAWLPVKDFEIGVEMTYARVTQDVNINPPDTIQSFKEGNWTGRLRVERNF